jgi:ADP-L-glycero-D-manno-heptose 6-epimerase
MSSRRPVHIVTGGAGFIGSNIVAALDGRDDEVIVADVLGDGEKWRNLAGRRLLDLVAPDRLFDTLDAQLSIAGVIHMGAISSTTERDADLIVETNFRLSRRLWDWCAQAGVPFVYASSAATYGDGAAGFEDRDDAAHLARLKPLNAYGWSKHLFDRWVRARLDAGDAAPPRWAGLKFFNVYGPNEAHKGGQRSVAHQIYEQIQRGEPVRLFASDRPDYPDGGQKRDFVWVGDCADIALWFIDGARPSGIYNVGTGTARTFADLAGAVFAAMGRRPVIEYVPMPDMLRSKYQYFTEAPMRKLAAAGFPGTPTPLEAGIARYVRDYLAAADPYR